MRKSKVRKEENYHTHSSASLYVTYKILSVKLLSFTSLLFIIITDIVRRHSKCICTTCCVRRRKKETSRFHSSKFRTIHATCTVNSNYKTHQPKQHHHQQWEHSIFDLKSSNQITITFFNSRSTDFPENGFKILFWA